MPTTNREKNTVMTYLDYLDNPEYPLGITNQFFEVFIHQQRLDKPKHNDTPEKRAEKRARNRDGLHMATRALESITYELGNYLHNAATSLDALREMQDFLHEGITPKIAIGEEVPIDNLGLRALIRYRDLARYRDRGELPKTIADPLRTKEDRIRKESERSPQHTGANKIVEDLYLGSKAKSTMDTYVAESAASLTIAQARRLIGPAIQDQAARYAFYSRELTGVVEHSPEVGAFTAGSIAASILHSKLAS
jgi:hypothetical protein